MNTINTSNIIEQWTSLTPQLRQNFYKTYIKAMSECDLVAQWDKMTDTQKNTTGITTNQTQDRQFPANMPVIKQLWLLVTAREQKTK